MRMTIAVQGTSGETRLWEPTTLTQLGLMEADLEAALARPAAALPGGQGFRHLGAICRLHAAAARDTAGARGLPGYHAAGRER
jgi:hypothetical protein